MNESFLNEPEQGWAILQEKLTNWYENILNFLPNVLLALLGLIIFLFIGRVVSRTVRKIAQKLNLPYEFAGLLATLTYLLIGGIGVFAALGILNLNKTVTSLLAGAGIIGLVLSLAFQNVAINILSGAIISLRRPIAVGDVVESNGYFGTVAYINWRTTHLITFQGQYVHIPNKEMIEQPVSNYTKYGRRRVEITMRLGYDVEPEKVRRVAIEALNNVPQKLSAFQPEFYYEEFESDALEAKARFWIPYARETIEREYKEAVHQGIVRLRAAFRENGITIPYHRYQLEINGSSDHDQAAEANSVLVKLQNDR